MKAAVEEVLPSTLDGDEEGKEREVVVDVNARVCIQGSRNLVLFRRAGLVGKKGEGKEKEKEVEGATEGEREKKRRTSSVSSILSLFSPMYCRSDSGRISRLMRWGILAAG